MIKLWFFIVLGLLYSVDLVNAIEGDGVIILETTSNASIQTIQTEFQPMDVRIVKIEGTREITVWKSIVNNTEGINLSLPAGNYKIYAQYQGHRTIWDLGNYTVSPSSTTVVALWVNTIERDVFADAPWRVEPTQNEIPVLVMIKDADGDNPYSLDRVEIYRGHWEYNYEEGEYDWIDDAYVGGRDYSPDKEIGDEQYNLYFNGDWYDIISVPKTGLSGETNLHVVLKTPSIWDLDPDAHSYFTVKIATDELPSLAGWYSGDTHFHSYYSDNVVEFGFPVEATTKAGKSIGLDWVTVTEHSFDLDSKMKFEYEDGVGNVITEIFDETGKWNQLKNDCKDISQGGYSDSEFKCIEAEEISVRSEGVEERYVHYLAYKISGYILGEGEAAYPQGGSEVNVDTGGDGWDDVPRTYNLSDVISNVSIQGGFGYGAHPTSEAWYDFGVTHRIKWQPEDYNLTGYSGFEIWNSYGNSEDRDSGIEEWKKLLAEGRHIFVSAGSDAHGDFSHATSILGSSDNAFGKLRTYIYSPSGFTKNGILEGLKYGHSIMTDGPLVIFTANGAKVGDAITVAQNSDITLDIQGASSPEFGEEISYTVYYGVVYGSENPVASGSFNAYPSNADTKVLNIGTISNNKGGYFRIEATTDTGKKAYTNPIWIEIEGAPICPSANETCPLPDTTAPTIFNTRHDPATPSSSDSIHVYADIIDDTNVSSAVVWYTTDGANWQSIPLTNVEGDTWRTITPIPAQLSGTDIQYTVCATDGSGNNACEQQAVCPLSQELAGIMDRQENETLEIDLAKRYRLSADAKYYSSQQACSIGVHTIIVGIIDTTPPGTPTLYDPGATLNEGEYYVAWSSVTDAESGLKHYELQESNTPTFQTTSYYTSATSYLITGKSSGTYYYRVRAIDNADNPSSWSNTQDVIIDIPPVEPPAPPAPSWSAIDSFDDESGTAYGDGWTWGDWRYEELLDDGTDNYVKKVSGLDGRSGVGLFYWGTTLGDTAPQAIEKSNSAGWDFSYSEGEWAIMMNNRGPWDEYVQLYFWDVNGREAATYLKSSRRNVGWEQLVWDSTLILYQAMDADISAMEIPEGAIVAQAGFEWNNVSKVKLWVEKSRYDKSLY